jgi:hypothetical protein
MDVGSASTRLLIVLAAAPHVVAAMVEAAAVDTVEVMVEVAAAMAAVKAADADMVVVNKAARPGANNRAEATSLAVVMAAREATAARRAVKVAANSGKYPR